MGLHGNSFMPMFLALGCNVPALMGTRIINSPKARLITIMVIPTTPCLAKIAVVTFLAPIFFGSNAVWVTLGLLGLVVMVIAILGTAYHELLLGGEHTSFIMELPLYHVPDSRNIAKGVWQRLEDFLRGAGTVILVFSVILWWLTNYPGGGIESSYLAMAGRWLSPIGHLVGLNWQMMVALLSTVVRSENIIPTLAVIYGTGQGGEGLAAALQSQLTHAAALAFLAIQILFVPCAATIATVRQETKSWRWTLLNVGVLFLISLSVGFVIYQGACLLGWGV
jgi:ferrous iron transport protein B